MLKSIVLAGIAVFVLSPEVAWAQANADRATARANFRQADANGDGRLNRREFRAFIDANAEDGLSLSSTVRRFGAYDRAFARVDSNGDGIVTSGELNAAGND